MMAKLKAYQKFSLLAIFTNYTSAHILMISEEQEIAVSCAEFKAQFKQLGQIIRYEATQA
jgi:hypothetical protein